MRFMAYRMAYRTTSSMHLLVHRAHATIAASNGGPQAAIISWRI
jgi:hypothetical protein